MLIVEMGKKESTGGHIKIMLFIEITKIKLTGGHIEFMLFLEMAKIESTGGHIKIMLVIEMAEREINRRLYWIYANCRDGQNRITAGTLKLCFL